MFIIHAVIAGMFVADDSAFSCENTIYKLSKRVSTRLEQLDSSIIDTTLEERTKIAEWFVNEKELVGIKKESSNLYTLFYNKSNNIDEEEVCLNKTLISKEIANQMIKGYVYPISALLTYNAPSNEK